MRPVVALLKARPETIREDYQRLLGLVGVTPSENSEGLLLAIEARQRTWFPGLVCPPWQIAGVLDSLSTGDFLNSSQTKLIPVSDSGPEGFKPGQKWGWEEHLADRSLATVDAGELEGAPYRSQHVLPSLESVCPGGFQLSPHWRGKDLVMLSSMGLEPGGGLKANFSLLESLLAPGRKRKSRIPESEILAEVMGLAADVFSSFSVVTDATIWSLARRGGTRVPLVRNLLVAGNDPVAVDSVLTKLVGKKPSDSPWLSLSESRGLGIADLEKIRIVGEPELMDLDFRIPEDTFASGHPVFGLSSGALWSRLMGRSDGVGKTPVDSAWAKLFREYQSGAIS